MIHELEMDQLFAALLEHHIEKDHNFVQNQQPMFLFLRGICSFTLLDSSHSDAIFTSITVSWYRH